MSQYTEWKCPFCGADINPGDQVCIHCGKPIHNTNVSIADLRSHENSNRNQKEKTKLFLIFSVLAVLVCILVVFFIVWFGVLKK